MKGKLGSGIKHNQLGSVIKYRTDMGMYDWVYTGEVEGAWSYILTVLGKPLQKPVMILLVSTTLVLAVQGF